MYFALIEDLKKREEDKTFDKLRDDSHNYYKEMTLVKPNDIVLHLTEKEAFTGISRVAQ